MDLNLWKQRKKELKLNYSELAEKSGVPITTVKNIFCGYVTAPRIDTVDAIEKALGINSDVEWTEEEKAQGVGHYPTYLSNDEIEWLELRSEVLRVKGEEYLKILVTMIEAVINTAK